MLAREKALQVVAKLCAQRLTKAAELVETGIAETLAYYAFPEAHWRRVGTTDVFDKRFLDLKPCYVPLTRVTAWRRAGRRLQALPRSPTSAAPPLRHPGDLVGGFSFHAEAKRR